MRLAKLATTDGPRLVLDDRGAAYLTEFRTFREALEADVFAKPTVGRVREIAPPSDAELLPVADPGSKVICVGHNYRSHITELGHPIPEYPNVFCKYPEALVGPVDSIRLNPAAGEWDWEAELAVMIARPASGLRDESEAIGCLAGYTVANDISARDWQRRATQWLLGKTFEGTTPVGPWLVDATEVEPQLGLTITCAVDGVEKQRASTADLVFPPHRLVAYLSQVMTLQPGDLVLTGTPGGVGMAREPKERLVPGSVVVTEVAGVGRLVNTCV